MSNRPLRPYQADAIARLRQSIALGHRKPVLQLPTGGGKTRIAGEILGMALAKGRRACFVVPTISLIDQTVRSLWTDGIREVGVIQADHHLTDASKPIQVASVQTLSRRQRPDVGLVLVDECHQQFKTITEWMSQASIPFVGLSATPWAKGMGKNWDDLIVVAKTQELIDEGILSPFRAFAPSRPDLSGVGSIAGDYHEGELSEAMDKPELVADVVETWLRRGEGRPTLCFGVDRAHAQNLQARFEASGVPTGYIDSHTSADDRETVRCKFHVGEYRVVCNIACLTTGVDWDVRCIILARPTQSEMLFTQIIGRGLRTASGKADCLILDHSDTHNRLGFVTDIHHETLDAGDRRSTQDHKRKVALPKECPQCSYLRPPRVSKCPCCGFKPEQHSGIEEADGELIEVRASNRATATKPAKSVNLQGRWIKFEAFYAQLKAHEANRGFKEGWAARQFRELVGVWPNAYRGVRPQTVSPEVASWIKSKMIRFAKSKATNQNQGRAVA